MQRHYRIKAIIPQDADLRLSRANDTQDGQVVVVDIKASELLLGDKDVLFGCKHIHIFLYILYTIVLVTAMEPYRVDAALIFFFLKILR